MHKIHRTLLLVLVVVASLSSCKKDEPYFNVGAKSPITFDDQIDKTTADYPVSGNVNLKVGVTGAATSVKVTSTYSGKSVELGNFPVAAGVATLNIPVRALRATADGPIPGAGSAVPATPTTPAILASSRAANTYVLVVDAVADDKSYERRYFTAVIVR